MFDNERFEIECQKCGAIYSKTIRWVKANKQLRCKCGAVTIVDSRKLQKKIKEIENILKRFGK